MITYKEIQELVDKKDYDELRRLIDSQEIFKVENHFLTKEDYEKYNEYSDKAGFYDRKQMVQKVLLNSLYGATINRWCRFYDPRLGASTTSTGRQITSFMTETAGYLLTGEKHKVVKESYFEDNTWKDKFTCESAGVVYGDTDSIFLDTIVQINGQDMEIQDAFSLLNGNIVYKEGTSKETKFLNPDYFTPCYDPEIDKILDKRIKAIYRHRVSKPKWKITDQLGNEVIVTGDHSIMVEREGKLIEVKPKDMLPDDLLISIKKAQSEIMLKAPVQKIEQLEDFDDEWVYDLVMEDSNIPWYFGNNILVHNSVYFKMPDKLSNNEAIELADFVGDEANKAFPAFMEEAFNCQDGFKELIKCGREVVADYGIFQAKKKYVLRCINVDGFDIEPGSKKSIKAMGSDIKKSDTPPFIQNFLKELTLLILSGSDYKEVEKYVNDFRDTFKKSNTFNMCRIMSVNKLDTLYDEYIRFEKTGIQKVRLSGHARAAINFNEFIKKIGDSSTQPIQSGAKVKVFYLNPNQENYKTIAISSDLSDFPDWFHEYFSVDIETSEQKLINAKIEKLFEILQWELPTIQNALTNNLLDF